MSETRTPIDWDPACYPTAEQWRGWFLRATEEEQLRASQFAVEDSEGAHRCFLMNHEGDREHLTSLAARLAKVEAAIGAHAFGHQEEHWRTAHHNGCHDVVRVDVIRAALEESA